MISEPQHDEDPLDMTIYCERLAERLRRKGVSHPVAAAVALAARGHRGVDTASFAAAIGMRAADLSAIEAGAVAFADLPDEVALAFAGIPSANLFLLADYDKTMGARS